MQRLEVSGAVRPLYGLLGVKGLKMTHFANSLTHKPISTGDAYDVRHLRRTEEFK